MKKRARRISTLGSRVTSLVSICLVLMLLGSGICLVIAGYNLRSRIVEKAGFVIVMERACDPACIKAMKTRLNADRAVENYGYTSAEAVLEQEAANLGEDVLATSEVNPYSAEFDVRVRPEWANTDSVAALVERYYDGYGVDDIVYESDMLRRADSALQRAALVLGALALVLLIISIGLINNTVSLSIYGRRFIIHAMKLVGARAGFIRRPFVVAGLRGGIVAGLVAGAILAGARWYASTVSPLADALLPWEWCAAVVAAMILLGGLICCLTAYSAACRYLRSSYDEMFMK